MGSVFATIPGNNVKGFLNKKYDVPFYLQFVPGYVVEVVHSYESLRYDGDNTLNTIIAIPHISDQLYKRRSAVGDDYRYFPLLRGMVDVPSKGDPVLLTTIGKTRYYLGPINTTENNLTWNKDPRFTKEIDFGDDVGNVGKRGEDGESIAFNKNKNYRRLHKIRKDKLDYGDVIAETTGDTLLEGRHGNSIRLGSRSNNSYVFISNGRNFDTPMENLNDGSIISLTKYGTLNEHFGVYRKDENGKSIYESSPIDFILSSDKVEENQRLMSSLVQTINDVDDVGELIYNYKQNQALISSGRITLNSKTDDIYISSNKDIHIGTGRTLSISNNEDLIIESNSVFLGNPIKNNESRVMEPMVLGEQLKTILQDLIDVLQNANGVVQGVPVPLVDSTMAPLAPQIISIGNRLNDVLSQYHYIEPNDRPKQN